MQARLMSSAASVAAPMRHKVAVILSGCGVYDGSETHETSAVLVHLSRNGAEPIMYAPDVDQMHVVNHTKGEPHARIARGNVADISNLKPMDMDAVVFPGGFGVAKNLLCCIAPILAAKVLPNVDITLGHDKDDGSGNWPFADAAQAAISMGANHHNCNVLDAENVPFCFSLMIFHEIVIDEKNLLVTTPAFMYGAGKFHEIHDGVGNMITALIKLIKT
ncbi:ES1, mitochondrial [Nymphon striatum]|nr:ES1, mitochondrial [Nymphon striatum]